MSLACDGGTQIKGRIRDQAGSSLSDVSVTLTVGERATSVRTDAEGRYRISMTHSPFNVEEKLSFEKSGCLGHQIRFLSHDGLHELDVTLQPTSAQTH
jgi:carboxypeptidase family protein